MERDNILNELEEMDNIEVVEGGQEIINGIIDELGIGLKKEEPLDRDEVRRNLLNDGLKISDKIEYIDLNKLREIDESINFFALPNDEEFIELTHSIENYGIIEPLLVMWNEAINKYIVINGRSRLYVLRSLYLTSKLEKFANVPCIILDSDTDPSLIQGIIISTNLKYRKISREILIKSIFLLDEILKKNKKYRNEINIAETIASKTGVSRTTVNNYMLLKPLSPLAMDLVNQKLINLKVARLLARTDHEKQKFVIETLRNNINDVPKVKSLIRGPVRSVYDEEEKRAVPDTWERRIEFTKKMVPVMTTIIVNVAYDGVEDCLEEILGVKEKYGEKFPHKAKHVNEFFKIRVNERHMNQYVEQGYLREDIFNKIKKKLPRNQKLDIASLLR